MPEFLTLVSCDEARAVLARFPPVGSETVAPERALARVLSEDLLAPHEVPPWPRATMDGYAVRARDTFGASDGAPAYLRLCGTVPMGGTFAGAVGDGAAVGISTGGVVPDGADAVVMIEFADRGPAGEIEVRRSVAPGDSVLRPGEDFRRGDPVLCRGRRLRPQDVGLLAGFGVTRIPVHRRPKVAILSTGNEVVPPESEPGPGQVRDINQYVLGGQVARAGGDPRLCGIVRDDAAALEERVSALVAESDLVILSGGSSVGVRDVAADVLRSLAGSVVLFHGINIRPGRPTLAAIVGEKPVLGMPGYPVSSMVVFDVFVRPLVWRLGGESEGRDPWPARRRARMARRAPSVAGREDYLRVRLEIRHGDENWAVPVLGSSASFSTVVRADGLVRVESGCEGIEEGEEIEVLLYE